MKFYEPDVVLRERMEDNALRAFVHLSFDLNNDGCFTDIPLCDVLECKVREYEEAAGGIVHVGVVILDNSAGVYSAYFDGRFTAGVQVRIRYCVGDVQCGLNRFTLYVDHKGFQVITEQYERKTCRLDLVDLSYYLKETDRMRDWGSSVAAVGCVVCDKGNTDKSLVHLIALRAGLTAADIDCGCLPFVVEFAQITGNVWAQLSELARAYCVRLECGARLPLTFAYSPYERGGSEVDEGVLYTLEADEVVQLRCFEKLDAYRNTVRLKWNRFVAVEKTELWRYADAPVWFTDDLQERYPFGKGTRDIEKYDNYEAVYSVKTSDGRRLRVVYASEVDNRQIFESNLETASGVILCEKYDTTTYRDRAVVRLAAEVSAVLAQCVINGKAIVVEPNYCHFITNKEAVAADGVRAENVTNKYLSGTHINGIPFYEVWAADRLLEVSKKKRGYFVKTNKAVCIARAGAVMALDLTGLDGVLAEKAMVDEVCLRYKKNAAFETTFRLTSM